MKNDAGDFSDWLNSFLSTMKGDADGDVPCGDCVGCCTSSKFILVRPTDTNAIKVIPKELLFAAPGLPNGFHLMGYNELGHCPMFVQEKCSIYTARPETCRQYDCRVLAATEASLQDESNVIAKTVNAWQFRFEDDKSVARADAVQRAMIFLNQHIEKFPEDFVPPSESQRAALAVRIHSVFADVKTSQRSIQDIIRNIVTNYPARGSASLAQSITGH